MEWSQRSTLLRMRESPHLHRHLTPPTRGLDWRRDERHRCIDTYDHSRHELHRAPGRVNYLKSQNKRQKTYDEHVQRIANSYQNGDLVGKSISKVDRTNCDPKIMPCLIEKRTENNNVPTFSLISSYGRLSVPFPVHQLIPMAGIKPGELQNIDYKNLPTITLVQASKLFARGNPSATCDCKTRCVKNTCPCRRASIACSTKCHARLGKCLNAEE